MAEHRDGNKVMSSENALATFATWISEVPREHGPLAYERACSAVLDTLGCALAGVGEPGVLAVRRTVSDWGAGNCTVWGSAQRVSPPWAALANGTAVHALDFDDYENPGNTHPSAVLLPALLALGEARGASGRELLDAYVIGLEIIIRCGEAVNLSHYHRGWHSTCTLGTLGAAAACARLLGLDPAGAGHALGLATSMASGFNSQFGTAAKPLHAGLAAKNGIVAATLAAEGVTASADVLDGDWSLLSLMAGPDAKGFQGPLGKLGAPLGIEEYGLVVKAYPCCGYIHRSLDGLLDLRAAHGLTGAGIARVTARIPARNAEILTYPEPRDPSEARFSLQYCAAVAALTGSVTLADFTPEAVARPEVRAWLPKVTLETHPLRAESSDLAQVEPDVVTLELTGGETHRLEVTEPRGAPARPLGADALMAKFRACAGGVLPDEAAEAAGAAVLGLDELPDLDRLTRHLRPAV